MENLRIVGENIFTIDQLQKKARELALANYKQKKEEIFWSTKPMLDKAYEDLMEIEFEIENTEFKLVEELLKSNKFFDKEGYPVYEESFSEKSDQIHC